MPATRTPAKARGKSRTDAMAALSGGDDDATPARSTGDSSTDSEASTPDPGSSVESASGDKDAEGPGTQAEGDDTKS